MVKKDIRDFLNSKMVKELEEQAFRNKKDQLIEAHIKEVIELFAKETVRFGGIHRNLIEGMIDIIKNSTKYIFNYDVKVEKIEKDNGVTIKFKTEYGEIGMELRKSDEKAPKQDKSTDNEEDGTMSIEELHDQLKKFESTLQNISEIMQNINELDEKIEDLSQERGEIQCQ